MNTSTLLALAHFCNDYHSGQNSRGYKLLCKTLRLLRKRGISRPIDIPLTGESARIYRLLELNQTERM